VIFERLIASCNPIPERVERSVRSNVVHVMIVVPLRSPLKGKPIERAEREIISAVCVDGLENSNEQPEPKNQDMDLTDNHRSSQSRNNITQNSLNGMCVFACDADSCLEFVMLFVNVFVDEGVMQEPMAPVE